MPLDDAQTTIDYLNKLIAKQGVAPGQFTVMSCRKVRDAENYFLIQCKVCNCLVERIVCDWSDGFDLDGLARSVIQFSKSHRHPELHVPDLEGKFASVVERPKGYRKFRNV